MSEVENLEFPQEAEQEDAYLVLIGAKRWVSSFVNSGKVIEPGNVVKVGPVMAGLMLTRTYVEVRTGLVKPMFRRATEKEKQAYLARLDNLDPETADPALLAEAARKEAMARGDVEFATRREVEAIEEIAKNPFPEKVPVRSKRRKKAQPAEE